VEPFNFQMWLLLLFKILPRYTHDLFLCANFLFIFTIKFYFRKVYVMEEISFSDVYGE